MRGMWLKSFFKSRKCMYSGWSDPHTPLNILMRIKRWSGDPWPGWSNRIGFSQAMDSIWGSSQYIFYIRKLQCLVLEWIKFAQNPLRLWWLYGWPLGTMYLEWQIQIVISVSERADQKVSSDCIPKYWREEFSHWMNHRFRGKKGVFIFVPS